ncbi:hypothetical protein [Vibrio phage vB_VhaS-a]|nr:hypothetical protein [Vibrio phage vB_VhaS-a]
MATIVRNFWVLPQGAKTTKKRNQFLGNKHNAIVLNGTIRDEIVAAAKFKGDGLLPVKDVPLTALIAIRDRAIGKGDKMVYRVLKAIIETNFLEEEIDAVSKGQAYHESASNTEDVN